ncbi:MAG: amino acid permease [candidate division Zixibacteria bacterium]|nr:amino acid permease [candidate division Zixibacteria bacterium]
MRTPESAPTRSDSFGTDTELKRALGPVSATTVIVGSIIGSGIFAGPAIVAGYTGTSGVTLAIWALCGLMSFFGAVCYAELGGMMPRAGGQFTYLSEAYSPMWGFLFGWTSLLVVRPGDMAAIASAFATYAGYFIVQALPYPEWARRGLGIFTLLLIAYFNYRGIRIAGLIQNLSTFFKVGALIALVGVGVLLMPDSSQLEPLWPATMNLGMVGALSLAMVAAFGAYDGWDSSTYVAEEIKNPRRNVPLSILLGLGIATAVYLSVNLAYVYVLSNTGVAQSERVASDAMQVVLGPIGASLIAFAVMVSTFGTVNANVLAGPRVCYAMARERMFFTWAAKVHPQYGTPHAAIIILAVVSSVQILFLGSWEALVASRTAALWVFYLMNGLGVFILRRKYPDAPRPYKTWGYPVTPLLFLVSGLVFLGLIVYTDPKHSLIGLGITAVGGVVYQLWVKKFQEK